MSEVGVYRFYVGGIYGWSNDGVYFFVLVGGFVDEVDWGDEFIYIGSGGKNFVGNKRIGVFLVD